MFLMWIITYIVFAFLVNDLETRICNAIKCIDKLEFEKSIDKQVAEELLSKLRLK